MKSFQVLRANLSPYQHPDFMRLERALLESLPDLEYRTLAEFDSNRAAVLITNTHTVLRELPPGLLAQTRLIIHPNSGYDHFRQDHLLWQEIPLVVGHTIRAQAVAEYTLGCIFEGILAIPQHLHWSKDRRWDRTLLKGLPVTVFGHGHIGKKVVETLRQLGMDVTVVDPYVPGHACHWQEIDLKRMRIVISCMSLNSTSKHLFNEEFFRNAHEELLFINGARGSLVKEDALKGFLLSHPRAFAFLDVFENEPFAEEWHNFPQVWKTSHIAGVHRSLDQGILDFEFSVLKDYLNLTKIEFHSQYQLELLQNKWIQGELV